jgi:hypothetical protein
MNVAAAAVGAVAAAVIVCVVGGLVYMLRPAPPVGNAQLAFYSDDDGQTWFTDSIYKFPPIDHNGKAAVRAYVYSYSKGQFVGYLQRYKPAAVELLKKTYGEGGPAKESAAESLMSSDSIRNGGLEVKLPGLGAKWMTPAALQMNAVKSPDRSPAVLMMP